jgi:Na+-translocating ferredoxin:NAD+ oxidoreductase RnfG subunit
MRSTWVCLPLAAITTSAFATTYLSVEQAQQAIFPGATFTEAFLNLTEAQKQQIEQKAGVPVVRRDLKAWRVSSGGVFMVDEVIGKHDFITYAVGFTPDGAVKQVEILDYRESYGYEVRNPNWRRQFVGKTTADPLKIDQDIRNISGATLSSRHVTEGVRRLAATYVVAFK